MGQGVLPEEKAVVDGPQAPFARGWLKFGAIGLVAIAVLFLFVSRRPHPDPHPSAAPPKMRGLVAEPTSPARIQEQIATVLQAPPSTVDTDSATASLGTLIDRLRQALEQSRAYERYQACVPRESQECSNLFSTAMFSMLMTELGSDQATRLASDMLTENGAAAFQRAVDGRLRSSDPVERVITLSLLNGNDHLKGLPVPAEVYGDLANKSVVEAKLLLDRHADLPLPSTEIAGNVAEFATDASTDVRTKRAALAALATSRDAPLLAGVLEKWLEPDHGNALVLAPELVHALGACGPACQPVLRRMARDPRETVRHLAALAAQQDVQESDTRNGSEGKTQ